MHISVHSETTENNVFVRQFLNCIPDFFVHTVTIPIVIFESDFANVFSFTAICFTIDVYSI